MTILTDKKQFTISCTREPNATTVDQMLARVAALGPLVAQCARDIEQDRRLPAEIVIALKSARIYSLLVPGRYGGLGFDAPSALRVVSALAKLDGAVGWNAMIGQVGSLAAFLTTPALCEQIFGDAMDHILAGSGQPVGKAERVSRGGNVSGRWPFASGALMPSGSWEIA